MDKFTFAQPLTLPCPFCTGEFTVDTAPLAEPAVLHSIPMCPTYLETPVDIYLQMVRRELEKRARERSV